MPPDFAVPHIAVGALLLNEVHAANLNGSTDEDGDQEDWIELYNTTNETLDLTGVGLSNKAGSPYKWTFPPGAAIAPRAYLTVWASKKDRAVWGRPLHANFNFNSGVETAWLTSPGNITLDRAPLPLTLVFSKLLIHATPTTRPARRTRRMAHRRRSRDRFHQRRPARPDARYVAARHCTSAAGEIEIAGCHLP